MPTTPLAELPALIAWILSRLRNQTAIGQKVWLEGSVPQGTPTPYVIFSIASSPDGVYSGGVTGHTRPLVTVTAIGQDSQFHLLPPLVAAINAALVSVGENQTDILRIAGSHRERVFDYPKPENVGGTTLTYYYSGMDIRFFVHLLDSIHTGVPAP